MDEPEVRQRLNVLSPYLLLQFGRLDQEHTHTPNISEFNGDWGTHPLTP
jgi:hypothetical protein